MTQPSGGGYVTRRNRAASCKWILAHAAPVPAFLDVWIRFAGTLDTPTGIAIERHIFVAEKSDYYEIADALPKLAGWD